MNDEEIDYIAKAIRFLVPLDCGTVTPTWTDYGLATTDWPGDFTEEEQNLLRRIARTAVWALDQHRSGEPRRGGHK